MTTLGDPSTPPNDVAWLEKAVFLAAQELASFRASAAAERERAQHALREAEQKLSALESERSAAERRHAAELERAQAHFEAELAERVKAWAELGADVSQRSDRAAAAATRLKVEMERVAQLGRELEDSRAQLAAAEQSKLELLERFGTLEEQFAVAAVTTREATELAETTRGLLDRMKIELDQSIARCKQLDSELVVVSTKFNERSEDIESAERAVERLKQELVDATARIQSLERAANELQALRPELDRERDMRRTTNEKLDKLQSELDAERRKLQQTEAAAFEAKRSFDLAQMEVQSSRRERDESRRELEASRTRFEQVEKDLAELRQARKESDREVELTRELEKLRTEKGDRESELTRDLDGVRRELEAAKRDHDSQRELGARMVAELEAARRDRDESRRAAEQALRELDMKLHDGEARLGDELASLRNERDVARRELSDVISARTAQVELEKDRVAQLKVELDELRAELERTRSERETLREELALQQRVASGQPPHREQARPQQTRVEREQQMTVPIPDRAPANEVGEPAAQPAARNRPREGAYSVTHVEEEQVFVRKGGGGGRGNR